MMGFVIFVGGAIYAIVLAVHAQRRAHRNDNDYDDGVMMRPPPAGWRPKE